jgi:predicted DNA-binding antitoxin AbrB/MazE fold protein
MSTQATAIYENGVLRLLTPVSLPEQTRVRVEILAEEEPEQDMRRAEVALVAAGLVKPVISLPPGLRKVSPARRAELARLYATGGPLSEMIIADRDAR